MNSPPTLDYSPPAKWRLQISRKFLRRLAALGLLAILIVALYRVLPTTIHRINLLRAQEKCLAFMPPSTPAISGPPTGVSAPWPAPPECWSNLIHYCDPMSYYDYTNSDPYNSSMINNSYPMMLLFMHERISPTGLRRLVVIRLDSRRIDFNSAGRFGFGITPDIIEPGSFWQPPVNWSETTGKQSWFLNEDERARRPSGPLPFSMCWGEADPADASRFRLSYVLGTTRYYIHFQLQADGYTLGVSNATASAVPPPGPVYMTMP